MPRVDDFWNLESAIRFFHKLRVPRRNRHGIPALVVRADDGSLPSGVGPTQVRTFQGNPEIWLS